MNNFKKLIAVIMTLVCVFAYVVFEPASAMAEGARESRQLTENARAMNDAWAKEEYGDSPLVGGLAGGRGVW